jgi:CRP-like cAMP-binding protein
MIYNVIASVVGSFPEQYREMLDDISTIQIVAKDKEILAQGDYCKHLWFINTGAVKAFELVEGIQRVTHFFTPNSFFTNYYCWVTSNPSEITFKTVADSELIVIDQQKLMQLCEKHHIFDTIGRKIAERVYVQEFQLRKLLLNCSATERYEHIETNNPEVFQYFSLKDIASFIGITDVSLSRIRKQRLHK